MGRNPARAALAVTILAGSLLLFAGADASANTPPSGTIVAEQSGSETHYTASFGDADGEAVSYDWFTFPNCGTFLPGSDPRKITWMHPEGSEEEGGCPHGDGENQSHEGTLILKVTDESGNYTDCRYEGSLSGEVSCPSGGGGEPSPSTSPSSPNTSPSPGTSPSQPPPEDEPACPGFENSVKTQIVGTDGADTLTGTAENEVICGRGGDDVLRGGPGRDRLTGGSGSDECHGGRGRDRISKSCEET